MGSAGEAEAVEGFNPPPAVGPGETVPGVSAAEPFAVSIRPRRWGRGKRASEITSSSDRSFQSAPGGGAGGNRF